MYEAVWPFLSVKDPQMYPVVLARKEGRNCVSLDDGLDAFVRRRA